MENRIKWIVGLSLLFSYYGYSQGVDEKPNIVIIYADDLGWADLQSYGSTFYETPNLNKMAKNGIRFTNNYASCPVCSPSRASLMTGKYPIKTGVTDWIKGRQTGGRAKPYEKMIGPETAFQLLLYEKTIAEVAHENDYKTFFAGKWHLGEEPEFWPQHQGFDVNIGGWSKGSPSGYKNDSTGGYFTPYNNPALPDGPPGEYLTDRLTDECLKFLDNQSDKPFLMMYSLYAVHNPLQAPQDLIRKYEAKKTLSGYDSAKRFSKTEPWTKYENGFKVRNYQDNPVYAAMVENMDSNIGRIMQKLVDLGIDKNTLIIFTSDNGGLSTSEGSPTTNDPLRAGKGWLYEGGIRVPLILYWPGRLKYSFVTDVPVSTIDFFPTISRIVNPDGQIDTEVDGVDIFELLANPENSRERALFWHYPHYSNQGGKPGAAIVQGQYKLIYNYEDSGMELYDLKKDPGEKVNLAKSNKSNARKLNNLLQSWLTKNQAKYPVPNPGYREY